MNMREKMARAMSERLLFSSAWDAASEGYRDWIYSLTDVALDTLTEPTEAMLTAFSNTGRSYVDDGPDMPDAWQAMIRAAKEGK